MSQSSTSGAFFLHASAPFAAFRPMQAGAYRSTLPTIPHSAALGFVLNLASIEMRGASEGGTTQIRADVPRLQIAIGSVTHPSTPAVSSLFQQLHSYPVGASGKELGAKAFGSKFWIAPGRRELLVDFEVVIGVRAGPPGLRDLVEQGLRGELPRYGLPFAGENDFNFDVIEVVDGPPPSFWYAPLQQGQRATAGICRLTIGIDRADASRTTNRLFAPAETMASVPPEESWVWTPRGP